MLTSTILQAQMAQNLSARAQLLSNRTQELNSYSVAIEELLRSLTGADGSAGGASGNTASGAGAGAAAAAPSSGPGSSGSIREVSARGPSRRTGTGRRFASSILPGPMPSHTARPSDYLVDPVLHQLRGPRTDGPGASVPMSGSRESALEMEYEPYGDHAEESPDDDEEMSQEEEDQFEEEEEEEETEPLDDLLPSLSFNELGQSLMDLRAVRSIHAREQRQEREQAEANTNSAGKVQLLNCV